MTGEVMGNKAVLMKAACAAVFAVAAAALLAGCAGAGRGADSISPVFQKTVTRTEPGPVADVIVERLVMRTDELHRTPESFEESEAAPASAPSPAPEGAAPEAADMSELEAPDAGAIADGPVQAEEASNGLASKYGEYRIEPGDILEFYSYDDPELSRPSVTVRFDGHISLPLIEDISVNDLTRSEATERVRLAYEEIFIDPQLSLRIVESLSKSFYVMGAVERPAQYPFQRELSVLDAINTAGGPRRNNQNSLTTTISPQGQLAKAFVIREEAGDRNVFEYNLSNLSRPGPHESTAPVFPGDIVYVPEGVNLVYIIGEVGIPNVYPLTENATLLQMLAYAGGPRAASGNLQHVILMRDVDEHTSEVLLINIRTIFRTGVDVPLQPGDVIYVPRKPLQRLQEFVGRFTGSVSPVLSLYTQALNAWFEKEFIDQALDSDTGGNTLQLLNDLNNLATGLPLNLGP